MPDDDFMITPLDNADDSVREENWAGVAAWLADYFEGRLLKKYDASEALDERAIEILRKSEWPEQGY